MYVNSLRDMNAEKRKNQRVWNDNNIHPWSFQIEWDLNGQHAYAQNKKDPRPKDTVSTWKSVAYLDHTMITTENHTIALTVSLLSQFLKHRFWLQERRRRRKKSSTSTGTSTSNRHDSRNAACYQRRNQNARSLATIARCKGLIDQDSVHRRYRQGTPFSWEAVWSSPCRGC
jgi:hypothetical protein